MIQVYQSRTELSFRVVEDLFQQLNQWSYSIDEKVFNDQLTTGLFQGGELDQDTLALMRYVKDQGGILPYYGFGGSSGVCSYHFHPMSTRFKLSVVHQVVNETKEFLTPYERVSEPFQPQNKRRFKFSSFPYLMKEPLPEAWSGELPEMLDCRIFGRELENLARWKEWIEKLALSEQYIYKFGEVSVGVTGFAVKVHNVETNHTIDITDYDNW